MLRAPWPPQSPQYRVAIPQSVKQLDPVVVFYPVRRFHLWLQQVYLGVESANVFGQLIASELRSKIVGPGFR